MPLILEKPLGIVSGVGKFTSAGFKPKRNGSKLLYLAEPFRADTCGLTVLDRNMKPAGDSELVPMTTVLKWFCPEAAVHFREWMGEDAPWIVGLPTTFHGVVVHYMELARAFYDANTDIAWIRCVTEVANLPPAKDKSNAKTIKSAAVDALKADYIEIAQVALTELDKNGLGCPSTHAALALCHIKFGNTKRGHSYLSKCLRANPSHPFGLQLLKKYAQPTNCSRQASA